MHNCARALSCARCHKPIPTERQENGPFLCDYCLTHVNRIVNGVYTAWVPMVADVLMEMRQSDCDQDTAVRRLGGLP